MYRDRDRADHRAGALKTVRRVQHQRVHVFFAVRQPEAFLQDSDSKPLASGLQQSGVGLALQCCILAGIEAIRTSHGLEHQRAIVHRVRHRPDVIDGHLDRENAGEWNQPPGWL